MAGTTPLDSNGLIKQLIAVVLSFVDHGGDYQTCLIVSNTASTTFRLHYKLKRRRQNFPTLFVMPFMR